MSEERSTTCEGLICAEMPLHVFAHNLSPTVITWLEPATQYYYRNLVPGQRPTSKNCDLMVPKPEPTRWSHDTGQ